MQSPETLAAEVLDDASTRSAAQSYLDCAAQLARRTPNGREALDLNRIGTVLAGCKSEEAALTSVVLQRWPTEDDRLDDEDRRRGLHSLAVGAIRRHPFEPLTVVLDELR